MIGFFSYILVFVAAQQVNLSDTDFAVLARCVRGPQFHCDVAWWSSNEDLWVYKCVGVSPMCVGKFDKNGDGDVDLEDYAYVMAPGPRGSG